MQRALTGSHRQSKLVRYIYVYSTQGDFNFTLFEISKGFKQKMIAIGLVPSNFEMHRLKTRYIFTNFAKSKNLFFLQISLSQFESHRVLKIEGP